MRETAAAFRQATETVEIPVFLIRHAQRARRRPARGAD